jgi:hypothetical protein
MNDDTYKLRRKVIDYIYEANDILAKNGLGKLPRIDVRIIDTSRDNKNVLGLARMGDNIVWIPEKTLNKSDLVFKSTVLHEICHAAFATEHDENCILMMTHHKDAPLKEYVDAFLKHSNKNKHILSSENPNRKPSVRRNPKP